MSKNLYVLSVMDIMMEMEFISVMDSIIIKFILILGITIGIQLYFMSIIARPMLIFGWIKVRNKLQMQQMQIAMKIQEYLDMFGLRVLELKMVMGNIT